MENILEPIDNSALTCPECKTILAANTGFCTLCGYPIGGTPEQQNEFMQNRYRLEAQLNVAKDEVRKAGNTLFILAGLVGLFGIVLGFLLPRDTVENMFHAEPLDIGITNLVLAALYVGLGFWSRKKPFAALLIALILYYTVIIISAFADPKTIASGIIIKIAVTIYLVRGIRSAYQAEKIMKELNMK